MLDPVSVNMWALAPTGMVMPQTAQQVFLVGNIVLCAVAALCAERARRRWHSTVGYVLLLAGAFAVLNEPVVDVLGRCWFAARGAHALFTAWGVTIPTFMLPVYCWYVGGQALWVFSILQRGASTRRIFELYGLFALINVALEVPGLHMGIYAYFGDQPFEFFGFPLWWPICNALMPIVMATLVFHLLPFASGVRRCLLVLVGPMAAGLTNGAIAIPVWVSLNSGAPSWVIQGSVMASLGLGLVVAFLVARSVATDRITGRRNRMS